jgi:hypothetical protein
MQLASRELAWPLGVKRLSLSLSKEQDIEVSIGPDKTLGIYKS